MKQFLNKLAFWRKKPVEPLSLQPVQISNGISADVGLVSNIFHFIDQTEPGHIDNVFAAVTLLQPELPASVVAGLNATDLGNIIYKAIELHNLINDKRRR